MVGGEGDVEVAGPRLEEYASQRDISMRLVSSERSPGNFGGYDQDGENHL